MIALSLLWWKRKYTAVMYDDAARHQGAMFGKVSPLCQCLLEYLYCLILCRSRVFLCICLMIFNVVRLYWSDFRDTQSVVRSLVQEIADTGAVRYNVSNLTCLKVVIWSRSLFAYCTVAIIEKVFSKMLQLM